MSPSSLLLLITMFTLQKEKAGAEETQAHADGQSRKTFKLV